MTSSAAISVVIVDDDKDAIFTLKSYLELMPLIELRGTANSWQKAVRLIREHEPDLVFLDIEMPGKTGFELLKEIENQGIKRSFSVVFHTAYDKYTIQALRESAFDFILKPPREDELKEVVQRFIDKRNKPRAANYKAFGKSMHPVVALPTNTGIQFFPSADLISFECRREIIGLRSVWFATLNNKQTIRLSSGTNASSIISYLGSDHFIQLSQSVIVNISYVLLVEYKTNTCFLYPPFDEESFRVSRQYMVKLRERFDVI
jgi:two-component system LytT family response regulator